MATFTSTAELNMCWKGIWQFVGAAGTVFHISDDLYDEFAEEMSDEIIPGLTWVTTSDLHELPVQASDARIARTADKTITIDANDSDANPIDVYVQGTLNIRNERSSEHAILVGASNTAQSNFPFRINHHGRIDWGDGSTTRDTTLYRSAANVLRTDDTLSSAAIITGALTATSITFDGDPWYDVKAYGAVGDSDTDDTAAIQDAFDACHDAGGGTVYFPIGTYSFSTTLEMPYPATIVGAGMSRTTLRYTGGDGVGLRFKNYATNAVKNYNRIANFTIKNVSATAVTAFDLTRMCRSVVEYIAFDSFSGSDDHILILVDGSYGPNDTGYEVTAEADDDIITTATTNTLTAGTPISFAGLSGGGGSIVEGTVYWVISDSLTDSTFKISASQGGTALDITADLTAGTAYPHLTGGAWWNTFQFLRAGYCGTGIKFTGLNANGQGNENVVRDCNIMGAKVAGVWIECGDNNIIERSDFSTTQGGVGVRVNDLHARVTDCRVEGAVTGIEILSNSAGGFSQNALVDHCMVVGYASTTARPGSVVGISVASTAKNCKVINSWISGNFETACIDVASGADNTTLRGNTVYASSPYGVWIHSGAVQTRFDNMYYDTRSSWSVQSLKDDTTGLTGTVMAAPVGLRFSIIDVAASQTDGNMLPVGMPASNPWVYVGRPYQIRGITYRSGAAIDTGSINFRPHIGGTKSSQLNLTVSSGHAGGDWQGVGRDTNAGTDGIGLYYTTTTNFTPAGSLDIGATVWIEFTD